MQKHAHYFRPFPFNSIDVYRLLDVFQVVDPCIQHAVKKLIVAGGRGHKDINHDIQDAIDSLQRWQAMRAEELAAEATVATDRYELPSGVYNVNVVDLSHAPDGSFRIRCKADGFPNCEVKGLSPGVALPVSQNDAAAILDWLGDLIEQKAIEPSRHWLFGDFGAQYVTPRLHMTMEQTAEFNAIVTRPEDGVLSVWHVNNANEIEIDMTGKTFDQCQDTLHRAHRLLMDISGHSVLLTVHGCSAAMRDGQQVTKFTAKFIL